MSEHRTGIAGLRGRLQSAADLPSGLAAASAAFELITAVAEEFEEKHGRTFPAWAMVAAAAADGWHALAAAPSLWPERDTNLEPASDGEDRLADALASLASQLAVCLAAVAGQAADADDTAACVTAASEAARIHDLLMRDGR